MHKKNLG